MLNSGAYLAGISTVSMECTTPLVVLISAFVTVALPPLASVEGHGAALHAHGQRLALHRFHYLAVFEVGGHYVAGYHVVGQQVGQFLLVGRLEQRG